MATKESRRPIQYRKQEKLVHTGSNFWNERLPCHTCGIHTTRCNESRKALMYSAGRGKEETMDFSIAWTSSQEYSATTEEDCA